VSVSVRKAITFLFLTFAFSTPFYLGIIAAGTVNTGGGLYVAAIMWCPGVAALLTRLFFQRNLRGVGWRWGRSGYQAAGYLIPAIACFVVYGFVWLTGLGDVAPERLTARPADMLGFVDAGPWPLVVLVAATIGVLEVLIFATGEELGWRGLLVPELAKTRTHRADVG
jgi:membrane protease YdiL (CAAX protease family)